MRVRIDLPVGSQAKMYLLCSNAHLLLVYRNPTSLLLLHEVLMSRRQYTVKLKRPHSAVPLYEYVNDCLTPQEAVMRAEARTGLKHFVVYPS